MEEKKRHLFCFRCGSMLLPHTARILVQLSDTEFRTGIIREVFCPRCATSGFLLFPDVDTIMWSLSDKDMDSAEVLLWARRGEDEPGPEQDNVFDLMKEEYDGD